MVVCGSHLIFKDRSLFPLGQFIFTESWQVLVIYTTEKSGISRTIEKLYTPIDTDLGDPRIAKGIVLPRPLWLT